MDLIWSLLRESLPEAIGGLIALAIANAIGWLWAKRSHPSEEPSQEPITESQPRVKLPIKTIRKLIGPLFILGIFATYISFKLVGAVAGWGSLLILLGILVASSPLKYRRILIVLCLVLINALFVGTRIYSILVTNEVIIGSIESTHLRLFLEGPIDKALFATVFGLALGGILVIIPLSIFSLIGSEAILALFEVEGISRWDAFCYQWSLLLGIQRPWQVVENGEVKVTKPKGIFSKIGGPGIVVIQPGNAVVFEQLGRVTRIEGPGVVKTKRFECIKEVIDLRPQWATVKAENVLTKDRVPLTIELGVGYRIELKEDTDKRLKSALETDSKAFTREIGEVYRVYEETVRKAAYKVTAAGWQMTTREAAKAFLRDIVATYNFDDIFTLNGTELEENKRAIHKIEEAVKKKLATVAINWGVKITTIDIGNIEIPLILREQIAEQIMYELVKKWRRKIADEQSGEK